MKLLYAARVARFDILRATISLAALVTKWSLACDKKLHRLMSYVKQTTHYRLRSTISRKASLSDVGLQMYADADFAGDKSTARSTSGGFLKMFGPGISVPIAAISKKQTCVSHSTPEAELVAANTALRTQGLPGLDLIQKVFNPTAVLYFEEDNNTAITTINAGYSPTMRHLGRTHNVSLRWLHEVCASKHVILRRCDTLLQAADIFTKPFTSLEKWSAALKMISIQDFS
jgi:hypothetical protein